MTKRDLRFVGIDWWNRVIFEDDKGNYFGDLDNLFSAINTKEEMSSVINEDTIHYFGTVFGCEPEGIKMDKNKIKLIW